MNLLIEHQCPQCGAPVVLEETDRLIACGFCRVKSYLMPKGVFRYMLPSSAPPDRDLIYAPYWRFKGMLFSVAETGVQHRFVDVSHQAVPSLHFPPSLGLRSQAMKLRMVTSKMPGYFLTPVRPLKEVLDLLNRQAGAGSSQPIYHRSRVGETISLIYAPFYIKDRRIYDAVLNRPVSATLDDDFDVTRLKGGAPDWPTGFIATLCPDCGWDLKGQRDSLALICNNCNTIWRPSGDRLKRTRFAHIPDDGDNPIFLPFWRIGADISGIALNSYADLVQAANLPRSVQKDWHTLAFRFWVPAFKVRPRVFMNLERNLTLCQPQDDLVTQIPKDRLYPVNLPLREALESLKAVMGSFLKPPWEKLPMLSEIDVKPKSFLLIYVPFEESHHEYIHNSYKVAVNKNQLALSTNL